MGWEDSKKKEKIFTAHNDGDEIRIRLNVSM